MVLRSCGYRPVQPAAPSLLDGQLEAGRRGGMGRRRRRSAHGKAAHGKAGQAGGREREREAVPSWYSPRVQFGLRRFHFGTGRCRRFSPAAEATRWRGGVGSAAEFAFQDVVPFVRDLPDGAEKDVELFEVQAR